MVCVSTELESSAFPEDTLSGDGGANSASLVRKHCLCGKFRELSNVVWRSGLGH